MRKVRLWCWVAAALACSVAWPRVTPAQSVGNEPAAPRRVGPAPTGNPFEPQAPQLPAAMPRPPQRQSAAPPTVTRPIAPTGPIAPTAPGRAAVPNAPGAMNANSPTVRIDATGPVAGPNVGPQKAAPFITTYENQVPSLTVDWVTPASIRVGEPDEFELVIRNRGQVTIEDLAIQRVLPEGFELLDAAPRPQVVGGQPVWVVRQLEPNAEVRVSLKLRPVKAGMAESHARVTFSTESLTKFQVVEPMLKLTADAPETVILGNQAILNVTVENPGSGLTTNTVLTLQFADGLEPLAESTSYEIGSLNPGESRSIRVLANVAKLGDHKVSFRAVADHGLSAEAVKTVRGLGAVLAMDITGPDFRYVSRPATFKVLVQNKGTAPAHNVRVRCAVPQSFGFLEAKDYGKFDAASRTVNWFVEEVPAGGEKVLECELQALDRGKFPLVAAAQGERGLSATAQHETNVEGIAAILLEVIDLDDPVEVGAETAYEVLVTNQGTDFATGVQIRMDVPEGMIVTGVKGPSKGVVEDRTVIFEPLPRLAPRADAIYRISVRGQKPGDFRVAVHVQSETLRSPVTEEESTKVYQD